MWVGFLCKLPQFNFKQEGGSMNKPDTSLREYPKYENIEYWVSKATKLQLKINELKKQNDLIRDRLASLSKEVYRLKNIHKDKANA